MRLFTLSLAVATVMILASLVSPSFSTLGIGLSHYDPKITMYADESKEIPVGRIYNTGTEALAISCVWHQFSGNNTLPVTLKDANVTLLPDESFQVIAEVSGLTADNIDTYYGEVDIAGKSLTPLPPGNPVEPAGTLYLNVSIPRFRLLSIGLSSLNFSTRDFATLNVTVRNYGRDEANYVCPVQIDSMFLLLENLTVPAEQTKSFLIPIAAGLGTHNITVGDFVQTFNVYAATSAPYDLTMIGLAAGSLAIASSVGVFLFINRRLNHKKKGTVETTEN